MAHYRQQIRERVATTLTGLDTTGNNVFQSRIYNIEESKLPCICIYTVSETSEPISMSPPRSIEKVLDLVIEVYIKGQNSATDLDAVVKEVKEKMFTDRLINNLAKDSYLTTQELTYNGEGDKNIAVGVLTYQVFYHHTEGTLG
tara:strand:+ start:214 stop:645 length:432 start_codon:yes stop_codon:yes gene_type:complete